MFISSTVVESDVYVKNSSSNNPTHLCAFHEMYDYDWIKLVVCLVTDDIIHLKEKKPVLLVYKFKSFPYQKV